MLCLAVNHFFQFLLWPSYGLLPEEKPHPTQTLSVAKSAIVEETHEKVEKRAVCYHNLLHTLEEENVRYNFVVTEFRLLQSMSSVESVVSKLLT